MMVVMMVVMMTVPTGRDHYDAGRVHTPISVVMMVVVVVRIILCDLDVRLG